MPVHHHHACFDHDSTTYFDHSTAERRRDAHSSHGHSTETSVLPNNMLLLAPMSAAAMMDVAHHMGFILPPSAAADVDHMLKFYRQDWPYIEAKGTQCDALLDFALSSATPFLFFVPNLRIQTPSPQATKRTRYYQLCCTRLESWKPGASGADPSSSLANLLRFLHESGKCEDVQAETEAMCITLAKRLVSEQELQTHWGVFQREVLGSLPLLLRACHGEPEVGGSMRHAVHMLACTSCSAMGLTLLNQ